MEVEKARKGRHIKKNKALRNKKHDKKRRMKWADLLMLLLIQMMIVNRTNKITMNDYNPTQQVFQKLRNSNPVLTQTSNASK